MRSFKVTYFAFHVWSLPLPGSGFLWAQWLCRQPLTPNDHHYPWMVSSLKTRKALSLPILYHYSIACVHSYLPCKTGISLRAGKMTVISTACGWWSEPDLTADHTWIVIQVTLCVSLHFLVCQGSCWAASPGVAKNRTWLGDETTDNGTRSRQS